MVRGWWARSGPWSSMLVLLLVACDDGGSAEPDGAPMVTDDAEADQRIAPPPDAAVDMARADAAPDAALDVGPPDECADDSACLAGSICVLGECLEGCRTAEECGPGQVCEDAACIHPPCIEDLDCPPTGYCLLETNTCAGGCRLDEPCPAGPDGEARGCDPLERACVALVPCCDTPDCPPAPPGACETPGCADNGDCPGAQRCDGMGRCVEPDACAEDLDCVGERLCVERTCVDRCSEDADCPGARACAVESGRCLEADPCFGPLDCDTGRVCDTGTCRRACPEAPCAGAQVCDADAGLCREPEVCGDDADCRPGRRCVAGACIAPCLMDADCPAARVCDAGTCVEPAVCFGDGDCDPGRLCVNDACADRCGPENPCPGEQQCAGDGRCTEPVGCRDDGDCLGDRICDAGRCGDPCVEDADCPGTRACALDTGRCPEATPCRAPADCDPDRACRAETCVDACGPDNPCPGRQLCAADGLCSERDACADDADCLGERICLRGACAAPCRDDGDCPGTRTCDGATGRCPEAAFCIVPEDCDPGRLCDFGACRDGCAENRDCPADSLCEDGRCVAVQGCAADADCDAGQICDFEACVDPFCIESSDCPDPEVCIDGRCRARPGLDCPDCGGATVCASGSCLADGPCADNDACGGGTPVCAPAIGLCVGCRLDVDCPAAAQYCDAGRCVLAAFCAEDAACPGDRDCVDGRCAAGPCAGDRFDADPPGVLAARVYPDLVRCDGTEDRYSVDLAADEGLQVTLLDPDDAGVTVSVEAIGGTRWTADGPGRVETVGLAPAPAPRRALVRVDGPPGRSAPYTLIIDRVADCPPDGAEGPLGNDTPATAVAAPAGPIRLCPGDRDHIVLALPRGLRVTATADDDRARLTLLDPDGGALAGPALDVRSDIVGTGRHILRVEAPDAPRPGVETALSIDVEPSQEAIGPVCDAAPVLAPGDTVELDPPGLGLRFGSQCGQGARADAVVRFTLLEEARVRFVADGRPELAVTVREDCSVDPVDDYACAFSGTYTPLPPGDWFAVARLTDDRPLALSLAAVPTVCADDRDCDAETVCTADGCLPPCDPVEGCDGAQVCLDRRCVEPDICGDDIDCVDRRVCLANVCAPPPPPEED